LNSFFNGLFTVILSTKFFRKKMEQIQVKPSVIEFKKKFEYIVVHYLQSKNLNYKTIDSGDPKKSRVEIKNLTSEDAFNLGAQVQLQLLDGEYLI
jgi:hypothetical protein